MSDIPTWHERAMAHPDHQSGMVSEDMIRARMCEEIADLRAEVERLIEWQSINHSEQHKLGWSMTEFCEGKRDHLHEMWERPPSLDYGIAHIEAEIKRLRAHNARLRAHNARLRAHNARLRAQIVEYFAKPTTHPVEDAE